MHPGTPDKTEPIPFEPGQRWSYHSRAHEPLSTVVVLRVDDLPGHGEVVSVAVEDVEIPHPTDPDGAILSIAHLPFAAAALRGSVIRLLERDVDTAESEDGYRRWRQALDQGEAGVFTVSVAEAVQFCDDAVSGRGEGSASE
mgnify:CR=1 FL=1|jgi:hypothetical protein